MAGIRLELFKLEVRKVASLLKLYVRLLGGTCNDRVDLVAYSIVSSVWALSVSYTCSATVAFAFLPSKRSLLQEPRRSSLVRSQNRTPLSTRF